MSHSHAMIYQYANLLIEAMQTRVFHFKGEVLRNEFEPIVLPSSGDIALVLIVFVQQPTQFKGPYTPRRFSASIDVAPSMSVDERR